MDMRRLARLAFVRIEEKEEPFVAEDNWNTVDDIALRLAEQNLTAPRFHCGSSFARP